MEKLTFNEWLVREGYARSVDTIENDLSSGECDSLYDEYREYKNN